MAAARSIRLPGGSRRLRLGDAAAARSHRVRVARRRGGIRIRKLSGAVVVTLAIACPATAQQQQPPRPADRSPLGPKEREAVAALLDAVDLAQRNGVDADARFPWDLHVLKSLGRKAYVPFVISTDAVAATLKSGTLYVRAVSRPRPGTVPIEQHSEIRGWLRGAQSLARAPETIAIGTREMPVGGPAVSSGRRSVQAPAEASTFLELQRRAAERQKARAEAERKALEERDPSLFPFEEYYFFDSKTSRADQHRLGRAVAIPPGEYDVYIAFLDRAHVKDVKPIVLERRLMVPDFWNDELRLSSLILSNDMKMLQAQLPKKEQSEQPFTFGLASAVPNLTQTFSTKDILTVVYQICNYGAPGAEMVADYRFYHVDGARKLFNGTPPQELSDDDLPPTVGWETQTFAMQLVPLAPFPPGRYELEVTVRDRTTRSTAVGVAGFTVR